MVKADAEACKESDPKCTDRVDANVCVGLTCDEVDDMISRQQWRVDNCNRCERVNNNAQTALDNCEATF